MVLVLDVGNALAGVVAGIVAGQRVHDAGTQIALGGRLAQSLTDHVVGKGREIAVAVGNPGGGVARGLAHGLVLRFCDIQVFQHGREHALGGIVRLAVQSGLNQSLYIRGNLRDGADAGIVHGSFNELIVHSRTSL